MNRNVTALVLIVVAIGLFFSYTTGQYGRVKLAIAENAKYSKALDDSKELLAKRDQVINAYNAIPEADRERLKKIMPDHIDNIRLIIDMNGIAAIHGASIKNVKTSTVSTGKESDQDNGEESAITKYDSMTLSFSVATNYDNFIRILREIQRSLRILDVSKISFATNETGQYEYTVDIKTYWLRQQ
jgi:hypothetical protein